MPIITVKSTHEPSWNFIYLTQHNFHMCNIGSINNIVSTYLDSSCLFSNRRMALPLINPNCLKVFPCSADCPTTSWRIYEIVGCCKELNSPGANDTIKSYNDVFGGKSAVLLSPKRHNEQNNILIR